MYTATRCYRSPRNCTTTDGSLHKPCLLFKIYMYIHTFQLKYFHDPVVSYIQRLDVIDLLETVQQQMEVYTNLVYCSRYICIYIHFS